MTRVPVFYSIRDNTIQLFSDKECAIIDQKLEGHELSPRIGHFTIEVLNGSVYIDEIMTREDYVKELSEREQTKDVYNAILELRR